MALAVLVLAAGVGGCGGDDETAAPDPKIEDAVPFVNSFVRRLVVGGHWEEIDSDVSSEISSEMQSLQRTLVAERRADASRSRAGSVKTAPRTPSAVPERSAWSTSSRAHSQSVPVAGETRIDATLRLWVDRSEGTWEVTGYTYDAKSHLVRRVWRN